MIFAAGFGTRMRPLTDNVPKPLIRVGGKPLIDHTLALVDAVQPDKIVMNSHYRADQLRSHVQGRAITMIEEQPEILDTGGGLKNAAELFDDGPVWTTNSDAIWQGPNPLAFALDHWDPTKMDALLVCMPLEKTVGRTPPGDFSISAKGRLSRGGNIVYGGVQIVQTSSVLAVEERIFSMNRIWDMTAKHSRLFGCMYPGFWADVGTPEGIPAAERLLDV